MHAPQHPLIRYHIPESQRPVAREGHVVGGDAMILPCLCVKCGASVPEGARRSRTLHHFPTGYWLLALLMGAWVVLVYLALRKPVQVNYAICPKCAAAERRKKAAVLGFGSMMWTSLWLQMLAPSAVFAGIFTAGLLGMVSMTPFMRRPLRVRKKDHQQRYHLEGAHPRVLARLSMGEARGRRRLE